MSRLDELRLFIEDKKPHIIGINETKNWPAHERFRYKH